MDQPAKLMDLFYEAALEPELWSSAIKELGDYVGRSSVSVLSAYQAPSEAHLIASVRYDPENWRRVQAEHSSPETNRYIELFSRTGVNEVIWPRRILSRAEWDEDPIIRKFLKPDRLKDGLGVPLQRSRAGFAAVAVFSGRTYSQLDVDMLRSAAVDLSRAFRMSEKLAKLDSVQYAAAAALDAISSGVILVDARGRLVQANALARMIFAAADGMSLGRLGQVVVSERGAGTRLAAMIRTATSSATRGHGRWSTSETAIDIGGTLAVPRPSGARPYIVVAAPIRSPRSVGLPTGTAAITCVLFVSDPEMIDPVAATDLSAAYGLTSSEAQVVAHLVAGHPLQLAARTMGVTINSARTLLQRAFDRCQVSRQSDLIALVLRGPLGFIHGRRRL